MRSRSFAVLACTVLGLAAMLGSGAMAQTASHTQKKAEHRRAKAEVEARDARHHNKLKTEGVPTVGGAVAGGVVAGPAGAFAGAKVGHTVGTVFHGVKKHRDIKRVEKRDIARRRAVARRRTRTQAARRRAE